MLALLFSNLIAAPELVLRQALEAPLPQQVALESFSVVGPVDWSETSEIVAKYRSARPGSLMVPFTVEGRARWVAVKLVPQKPQVVVTRALTAGSRLSASDLEVSLKPVKGELLGLSLEVLLGLQITRDLSVGDVLHPDDIVLPAPLPAGTQVQVVVRSGGVSLSLDGWLHRSLRVGEVGEVRVGSTPKPVRGRLLTAQKFEVLP